jgi:hypothetical protein
MQGSAPDCVFSSYAHWHAASARASDKALPEPDAYAAFLEAEQAARRLAATPARDYRELAMKLKVFVAETTDGETPFGAEILRAVIADTERLAGGLAA